MIENEGMTEPWVLEGWKVGSRGEMGKERRGKEMKGRKLYFFTAWVAVLH